MFHPVRNSLGLIVLYSFFIIGIFTLQFRNESVVLKRVGDMSISLAQTQTQDGEVSLKNSFLVSFRGISFHADEVHPVILELSDGSQKILKLQSFERNEDDSVSLHFDDDTIVNFFAENEKLSIHSTFSSDVKSLTMNFKPASGFSVTNKTANRQIFSAKDSSFVLQSSLLSDETLTLFAKNPIALFLPYEISTVFQFNSISQNFPAVEKYDEVLQEFRDEILSLLTEEMKSSLQVSENAATAFVAEMADRGEYEKAISLVPDSFKNGNKRTYLSVPYFGQLKSMFPSLQIKLTNINSMIENIAKDEFSESSLNIFTHPDLAEFLNVLKTTEYTKKMLSLPATAIENENFAPTLSQATGILRTYTNLKKLRADSLAEILESAIPQTLSEIEKKIEFSSEQIVVKENSLPANVQESAEAGSALMEYGEQFQIDDILFTGRALVSSALSNEMELSQMVELYPVIVTNRNYPHAKMLYREKGIWAWTGTENLSYTERNQSGNIQLNSKINDTTYTMIFGIPDFNKILIYGISYRSDPQFEKYNTSGFAYQTKENVLLLKTRHKVENETVQLSYIRGGVSKK